MTGGKRFVCSGEFRNVYRSLTLAARMGFVCSGAFRDVSRSLTGTARQGPWGYGDYLAAISDPEHERHDELLEWRGPFDPEAFDAKKATKAMKRVKRSRS